MNMRILTALTLLMLTLVGCRKEPLDNLSEEESRIYITNHDGQADFSSYQTFSITDSVTVIDNNEVGISYNKVDQAFIAAVKSNMQAKGYAYVTKSQSPDLALNVSRIIRTSTGILSYNYWDMYDSFYNPYYWGYGGYGYGIPSWGYATYQVSEGLLSIDMADLKNASTNNNEIKLIWNGTIRGSGIFDASTASSQVAALFEQSPYISNN
jgi:hypothetical protein